MQDTEKCGICGADSKIVDELEVSERLQCTQDENHFASLWDYEWVEILDKDKD